MATSLYRVDFANCKFFLLGLPRLLCRRLLVLPSQVACAKCMFERPSVTWWHCVCLWGLRVEQNLKQVPDTTKLLCLNVHVTGSGRHAQKQAGWSAVATLLPRLWPAQGPRATCANPVLHERFWSVWAGCHSQLWTGWVCISVKYCEVRCSGILNRTVCWSFLRDVAWAWDQTRDKRLEIVQIQSPDRIDPHQLAFHLTFYLTYSDCLFEFAFSCMFWHSRCPFVWHSIWHIIWHYLWQSLTYILIFYLTICSNLSESIWHVFWRFVWQTFYILSDILPDIQHSDTLLVTWQSSCACGLDYPWLLFHDAPPVVLRNWLFVNASRVHSFLCQHFSSPTWKVAISFYLFLSSKRFVLAWYWPMVGTPNSLTYSSDT